MKEELIEKIEALLDGQITKSELESYANVNGILNLEEEIEWVENAQLAIEANGLKNQLQEALATKSKPKENVRQLPQKKGIGKMASLSIAAAVALLFGILFFLKPDNGNQLYSKYEFVDPGIPVLMSETDNYEMYEALSYYSEQNYAETIKRLELLKEKNTNAYNDTIEFYYGLSNLYENQIEGSLQPILKVSQDSKSIFKERAEWMYALAHLKNGDIANLKLLLEPIAAKSSHPFNAQAIALLADLKE